jgi:putative ABC transport system permease protein
MIHVLGLAIGICACIAIYLIAQYEFSFDTFHPDAGRIYRVVAAARTDEGNTLFWNSPFPAVASIEHEVTGFEAKTAFRGFGESIKVLSEQEEELATYSGRQPDNDYAFSTILTGPDFFSLFPHQWLIGSPAVLQDSAQIVLTQSVARKYFGPGPLKEMLGRTLIYNDSLRVRVGGIVKDWHQPSDLNYTAFISSKLDWGRLEPGPSQVFVRLSKNISSSRINAEFDDLISRTMPILDPGISRLRLYLQSLRDMHYTTEFHPSNTGDVFRKAYLPLLYALMGIALFILVLAIINFINLSTAQSFQRMKEVGIRKVMGSSRNGLILQFLVETLMLTIFAVVLSLVLMPVALRVFSGIVPSGVQFHLLNGGLWLFLLALTLLTALTAGFYPARLLSSYLPVLSLKGALDKTGTGGAGLRRVLIVFQFTLSLLFIIGSMVIHRQVRYMRTADKGFNSEDVVTVDCRGARPGQMRIFADLIKYRQHGVRQVILEGNPPMGRDQDEVTFVYRSNKTFHRVTVRTEIGDENFLPFYGMRLVAGKNIYEGENVKAVIINETYARALGFARPQDALMAQLYRLRDNMPYTVMGVVADYHQTSFHETIKPMVIVTWLSSAKSVAIKLDVRGAAAKQVIKEIGLKWHTWFPLDQVRCGLLDDSIHQLYLQENNVTILMSTATGITVLISCMGLFGLALFSAGRRAKEVGIRKVMGATVTGIALLLSREFLLLVGVAIVIASPLAWWLSTIWLRDFAYRSGMDIWVVVEAGLSALLLALLTVSFQAVRAARVNPVKVLRVE